MKISKNELNKKYAAFLGLSFGSSLNITLKLV